MDMRTISRRGLLRALGGAGAAAALLAVAGCTAPAPPTEAPKPAAPPAGAPTAAAAPTPQTETKPAAAAPAAAGGKQSLTLLWHWGKQQTDFLQPYFDEYTKQTGTTIDIQQTSFAELLKKILVSRVAGIRPDVYHIYDLWIPTLAGNGVVAEAPPDVVEDLTKNFAKPATEAATVQGKLVGYPTQLHPYVLVRNKKLFREAGLDPEKPPATWAEFKDAVGKLTKKDAGGKVTQAGYATTIGDTSNVLHPWLALLWSNGGELFSNDFKKSLFNSDQGVETLQFYKDVIPEPGLGWADFSGGKVAMAILAPWVKPTLEKQMADGFTDVATSPPPYGKGGKPVTIMYNWAYIVDRESDRRDAAWAFLKWLNSPQDGKASRMGTYMSTIHGAIPPRQSDFQFFTDALSTPFMKEYVSALQYTRSEPNLIPGEEIKRAMQTDLEAVIIGKKPLKDALANAQKQVDTLLKEYYP